MKLLKNWLIKKLGGCTQEEIDISTNRILQTSMKIFEKVLDYDNKNLSFTYKGVCIPYETLFYGIKHQELSTLKIFF